MIFKIIKNLISKNKKNDNIVSVNFNNDIKLINDKISELEKLIYHLIDKINILNENVKSGQKILSQNILLNEEIAYNFDQTIKTLSREITDIEENFDTLTKENNKNKKSDLN